MSNNEEVEAIVQAALGELLNIATQVAELQGSDECADEIYNICDLVAEYYQIERARAITEEHPDGSFTTRFETFTGSGDVHADGNSSHNLGSGHIRTKGKPKLRLVDLNTPVDFEDDEDKDED
tara:strand:- start:892 stop:1260 length:369 start_codon:yes stop_codon:yes gene_type:complete